MRLPGDTEATDLELFLAFKDDRAHGLARIYRRYGRLVRQTAYRLLSDLQEADDLTQDIFLQLWNHCSYNPDRGSLASFLRTLTRSRALDRLRTHECRRRTLGRYGRQVKSASSGVLPLEWAVTQERATRVAGALACLPIQQRRVLQLAYYGGLSQSEIARHLGAPLGTVKSWTRQGQRGLRERLAPVV